MPEMFICVPEDYYSFKMQNFINVSCADPAKQWIYNVIQDKPASSEIVLRLCAGGKRAVCGQRRASYVRLAVGSGTGCAAQ